MVVKRSLVAWIFSTLRDSLRFKDWDDLMAFLPWALLFLVFLGFGVSHSCSRGECEEACYDLGYTAFRYKPESSQRYSEVVHPETCFCLTQEESERKGQIPKGVQAY
jgi:hypothetical protein